jgi:hypothetical protein
VSVVGHFGPSDTYTIPKFDRLQLNGALTDKETLTSWRYSWHWFLMVEEVRQRRI